ncbi:glycosyltransferase [Cobetia sp. L2A1]|uniref:glycosyltransferase n=1 Tax=Cobetia sp. L2A1 TaxID=2686360 RepID=UPI00131C5BD2|nr:glycosyltransferase [Cobetia sp. L2A1]
MTAFPTTSHWIVLSDDALALEDIYFFLPAMTALRKEGTRVERFETRRWKFSPKMANARLAGACLLIARSLKPEWIDMLEAHREQHGRICYLLDQDFCGQESREGGVESGASAANSDMQRRLMALADEVVVVSQQLVSALAGQHPMISLLTPPMIGSLPDLHHLEAEDWCVGFHGTLAHREDIVALAPVLRAIQACHEETEIELMMGRHLPLALTEIPRLKTMEALGWEAFQDYCARRRIAIGLAPLMTGSTNHEMSWLRFLDITRMGGVGIYSRRAPFIDLIEDGVDGLLVEDDPAQWIAALERLLGDRDATRAMAHNAQHKAHEVGDPLRVLDFWRARSSVVRSR